MKYNLSLKKIIIFLFLSLHTTRTKRDKKKVYTRTLVHLLSLASFIVFMLLIVITTIFLPNFLQSTD